MDHLPEVNLYTSHYLLVQTRDSTETGGNAFTEPEVSFPSLFTHLLCCYHSSLHHPCNGCNRNTQRCTESQEDLKY